LITGEATFHTCLEAESLGIGLGLLGHYWSERFAMERLALSLSEPFPELTIWASRSEHDPIVALP
jgi:putative NIF3 family GTP cyclohydrolase 1 type 2